MGDGVVILEIIMYKFSRISQMAEDSEQLY